MFVYLISLYISVFTRIRIHLRLKHKTHKKLCSRKYEKKDIQSYNEYCL